MNCSRQASNSLLTAALESTLVRLTPNSTMGSNLRDSKVEHWSHACHHLLSLSHPVILVEKRTNSKLDVWVERFSADFVAAVFRPLVSTVLLRR